MPNESEKNNGAPADDLGDACASCHQYFDKEDECWGNYVPLTREEEKILAQMRDLKAKVTEVQNRLKELGGTNGLKPPSSDATGASSQKEHVQWLEQKQYLEVLRQEWQELDRKRQEAAKFRMRILGHED